MADGFSGIFAARLSFWEHLSNSEKAMLCNGTTVQTYSKGEVIHSGGNDCIGVLLIQSGQLRTYMLSEDGRDITLFRQYANDVCILSASCVLQAITFDVFIEAEEDTSVLLISSAAFRSLTESCIYVQNFANELAADRFSEVMWAMQQILFMSFDRRLAIFLTDELAKTGGNEILLTHEQIAKYMGSAREVVSRMLKYFSGEGLVKLSRGSIIVLDKPRLLKLASGAERKKA